MLGPVRGQQSDGQIQNEQRSEFREVEGEGKGNHVWEERGVDGSL